MSLKKMPLFKSHYSIGKSILTLEKSDDLLKNGPDSIIDLALKNKLNEIYLVEDSMTGFLEAYTRCKENKINFKFGLRITHVENRENKNEDSLKTSSKIIIFIKNNQGYKLINRIFSRAYKDGFYYEPRVDSELLKEFWDDESLSLGIPFYDSFIFKNLFYFSICNPDFSFCKNKPVLFVEDNDLWFDNLNFDNIQKYAKAEKWNMIKSQSVYYNKRKDFKHYLTFKCINKRVSLDKPNLEHMTSDSFCLENCF